MSDAFNLDFFLREAPRWRERTFYYPQIDSTNTEARKLLNSQTPGEYLLVADQQTAGRGRLNRPWQAPASSGLLCSLTLPLAPVPLERAFLQSAGLALAVKMSIEGLSKAKIDLKWPNDWLREGKKCGGLLAEMETTPNGVPWLVLGFGLNISLTATDFEAAGLASMATNCFPVEGYAPPRELLLADILTIHSALRQKLVTDPQFVFDEWQRSLVNLGKAVQVLNLQGVVFLRGMAIEVEQNGALIVQDEQGQLHRVQAGDVSVRLADGSYA